MTKLALSKIIREARRHSDLSQTQISDKIGVSLRTFQRWEDGESEPDVNQIAKIAEITHKPIEYFFEVPKLKNQHNSILSHEVLEALENPLAVRALLAMHGIDKTSAKAASELMESIKGMDPKKIEALLRLIN